MAYFFLILMQYGNMLLESMAFALKVHIRIFPGSHTIHSVVAIHRPESYASLHYFPLWKGVQNESLGELSYCSFLCVVFWELWMKNSLILHWGRKGRKRKDARPFPNNYEVWKRVSSEKSQQLIFQRTHTSVTQQNCNNWFVDKGYYTLNLKLSFQLCKK